jgi:glucose-6-phosphate 1-epimerase
MQLPSSVRLVEGAGRLPRLDVSSSLATAQVYLHGGHVTSWRPSHTPVPVLWLSGNSLFQKNKPIRGGVPICFPWFGPHASDQSAPAHGFARISEWALADVAESDDGTVTLSLSLQSDEPMSDLWPYQFRITHRIRIASQLTMELEVENRDLEAFTFEEALHTYFAVREVGEIAVTGLHKTEYLDKVADFARKVQEQPQIRFTAETDRVYVDTAAACVVDDPGLDRRVAISNSGS